MKTIRIALPLLMSIFLAACAGQAMHSAAPAKVADGVLVGSNGMTLYTFDKDLANSAKSACNGPCATNWPPFLAMEKDQPTDGYATITRDDGRKQWTAKGKPLYFWTKDKKPGDKTGDGFNGVWKVATP